MAATRPQHTAFVYGTLMAEEVLTSLLQRVPRMQPAILKGYTRHCVKGAVYPAIVPSTEQESVQGQVLLELSDKELGILDRERPQELHCQQAHHCDSGTQSTSHTSTTGLLSSQFLR